MPSVILVDDEAAARRGMQLLLKEYDDFEVIGEAECVEAAAKLVAKEIPDLIFLDVEMPAKRGFALLDSLPPQVQVILVTAHVRFGAEAFDHEALDYLVKPVHPERLGIALKRYHRVTELHCLSESIGSLTVHSQSGSVQLLYRKISALLAEGDYTSVIMDGEPDCYATKGIGFFEELLPTPPFVRLSRSLIVNLPQVVSLNVKSRDLADLFVKGMPEPLTLHRIAIQKLRSMMK